MYQLHIMNFLMSMDEQTDRLKNAEKVNHLWKLVSVFIIASMIVYGCIGFVGIGSDLLLDKSLSFTAGVYESSKFWFIIGKILLGFIFAVYILFVPALLFSQITSIQFKKLLTMQLIVLFMLLLERVIWFFLMLTTGLDWYVSPLSFGVIASLLTSKSWLIVVFGTISLFQLWVMWFQAKFIIKCLDNEGKVFIWMTVILLHLVEWVIVALLTITSPHMISGWFG